MKDKKVIILIVVSVLAVAALIHGITAGPGGAGKKAAAISGPQGPAAQEAFTGMRHAKRSTYKAWKKSPFIKTGGYETTSDLALKGIIGSGSNLKAMIGDSIVRKGDKIGNNKVIDIKKDRVILNDGVADFEIKLPE